MLILLEIYMHKIYPQSYQDSVRFISVALCALVTSVIVRLFGLFGTLCTLLFKNFGLSSTGYVTRIKRFVDQLDWSFIICADAQLR